MIKFIGKLARLGVRLSFGMLPQTLVSFLIVGAFGVGVHLLVLQTALALATHDFRYANMSAMLVAASSNYFLNNESTFNERSLAGGGKALGYVIYLFVNGVGLLVSLFVSTRVYACEGMPMMAALSGIVAGALWNYALSYALVWKLISRLVPKKFG